MVTSYPCVFCSKPVKSNQKALLCTQCNLWAHIKCARVSELQYCDPNEHFVNWRCSKCILSLLPFFDVTDSADVYHPCDNINDVGKSKREDNIKFQFPKEKGIKVSHLNIRSLRNKIHDLEILLKDYPYELISLTETWLDEFICNNMITVNGYNLERKDRAEHGGGVCCYIRSNIPYIRRYDLEDDELELLWIEIKPRNETSFFVGTVYRQPSGSISFFDVLENNLDKAAAFSDRIVLLGDFNCNMLTVNSLSNRLNELSSSTGLNQLIHEPTRVTPNSSTLIDLIYASNSLGQLQCGVQSIGFSDHSLVYALTKVSAHRLTPKISRFRSFRTFDENSFLSDLASIDWDALLAAQDDVNLKWKTFKSLFLQLCDKHAPYITVRRKIKGSPWINTEYIETARERDFNKRKFNATKDPLYYEKFKCYRNRANNLNKKLKRAFYQDQLRNASNDMRKGWSILKGLIPNKRSNNGSNIVIDGELESDPSKIASEFNSMFSNVGKSALDRINKESIGKKALKGLKRTQSKFTLEEVSIEFIQKELSTLNCSKSIGLDDLHPRLLKLSAHLIALPIAYVFNDSIRTGNFPHDFKLAKIVPIPKSKSSNDLSNFRPISLLSVVSKIFERAVHSQLLNYLKNQNLMSDRQSGFRSNHSTATCLTEISDFLYDNIDKGRLVGAAFLDLRKAFDIIPHDLLLKKLEFFGITGLELEWFKSYLTGRMQCVSFEGRVSDFLPVYSGVPQGSILGPLIFCMYINDMSNLPFHPNTHLSLYADDTAIFSPGFGGNSVQKQLQKDINVLSKWFRENGMIVNTDKTKVMLFTSRKNKRSLDIEISMNGEKLQNVTKFKYLGVVVDHNLDWSSHINEVVRKITHSVQSVRRIKHCLNEVTLRQLYYTLILPHIDYCSTVWASSTKKNLLRLQRCQNKYARLILNADYYTPTVKLLDTLKWQSVEIRLNFQYCVMIYKLLHGLSPPYLTRLVSYRNTIYPTRHVLTNQLYLPKPRTENKKHSFSYVATKLYNSLPMYIQTSPSLPTFKKRLRQYQISC